MSRFMDFLKLDTLRMRDATEALEAELDKRSRLAERYRRAAESLTYYTKQEQTQDERSD